MDRGQFNLDSSKINIKKLRDLYPPDEYKYLNESLDTIQHLTKGNDSFTVKLLATLRNKPCISQDYGKDVPVFDLLLEVFKYHEVTNKIIFTSEYSLGIILHCLFDMSETEYKTTFGDDPLTSQHILRRVTASNIPVSKLKRSCEGINFFIQQLEKSITGNILIGYNGEEFNLTNINNSAQKIAIAFYLFILSTARNINDQIYGIISERMAEKKSILKSLDALGFIISGHKYEDVYKPIDIEVENKVLRINFNTEPTDDNIRTFKYLEVIK